MRQRYPIAFYLFALIVVVGFIYGVVSLLILRYEAGDIYPPYSSLRADPLGIKALYEGLDEVEGVTVYRGYKSATKFREQRNTTLLYVGLHPSQFTWVEKDIVRALEELLFHGNKVVLTFSPVYEDASLSPWFLRGGYESEEEKPEENIEDDENKNAERGETGDAETEKKEETPESDQEKQESEPRTLTPVVALHDRWDVRFKYTKLSKNDEDVYESISATNQSDKSLPETVSWHTSLYFDISARKDWNTVYAAAGKPVIIERTFGKGTLVLSADSYFLSNEAMRNERHPELLAWLIGPGTTVIFDETHLGVMETPGVASLLQKYRLMWFVAGLMILALLFVWKNAVSFVPPYDTTLTEEERSKKDVMAGLVNLLRQNIPSRDILSVCFKEWKKSFSHRQKELGDTLENIQATVEAEQARSTRYRNPVAVYKSISRQLKKPK